MPDVVASSHEILCCCMLNILYQFSVKSRMPRSRYWAGNIIFFFFYNMLMCITRFKLKVLSKDSTIILKHPVGLDCFSDNWASLECSLRLLKSNISTTSLLKEAPTTEITINQFKLRYVFSFAINNN